MDLEVRHSHRPKLSTAVRERLVQTVQRLRPLAHPRLRCGDRRPPPPSARSRPFHPPFGNGDPTWHERDCFRRLHGPWLASGRLWDYPGEQMIEIRFHHRIPVRRLRVVSSDLAESRTQEMTIWVSLRGGEQHREVVRQQFNFSPSGATVQVEEYALQLEDVSTIQVRMVPRIDGRRAVARVSKLHVASV